MGTVKKATAVKNIKYVNQVTIRGRLLSGLTGGINGDWIKVSTRDDAMFTTHNILVEDGNLRRTVSKWTEGDVVEIEGTLTDRPIWLGPRIVAVKARKG